MLGAARWLWLAVQWRGAIGVEPLGTSRSRTSQADVIQAERLMQHGPGRAHIVQWWPTIVLEAKKAASGTGFLIPMSGNKLQTIYSPR